MPSSSEKSKRDAWDRLTRGLADRGGVVDVTARGVAGDASVRPTYRVRLLEVGADRSLVISQPDGPDAASEIAVGGSVRLLAIEAALRLEATAEVRRVNADRLNPSVDSGTIELAPPQAIASAQRREFFRADTATLDLAAVELAPTNTPDPPMQRLVGRLVNISGGGMGLVVDGHTELLRMLQRHRHYCGSLSLATGQRPLSVCCELVHIQPIDRQRIYLGLPFEFSDDNARRSVEDQVVRFTSHLQRQQLRRRAAR